MAEKDLEIVAMSRISKMLGELTDEERARVVVWVARKFGPECKVAMPAITDASTAVPSKVSR